jgi:hypothetical protein
VYDIQLKAFKELDSSIPAGIRTKWEKLPLEAKEGPRGTWTSVFSTPSTKGSLQKCRSRMIEQRITGRFQEVAKKNREKESRSSPKVSKKPGVTHWLVTGIELENSM